MMRSWPTTLLLGGILLGCSTPKGSFMKDDPILGGKVPPAAPASLIRSPYSPASEMPAVPAALAWGNTEAMPPPDSAAPRPRDRSPNILLSNPLTTSLPSDDRTVLDQLGLREPRLEQLDDGMWRFSGSRPRRGDPSVLRRYDARASTPAEAIRAVRDQIQRDGY